MINEKLKKIDDDILTLQSKIKELRKLKKNTIKIEKENFGNFFIEKIQADTDFAEKLIKLLKEYKEENFIKNIELLINSKEENIKTKD